MASNGYQAPDLASILKTLTGLAQQNQLQAQRAAPEQQEVAPSVNCDNHHRFYNNHHNHHHNYHAPPTLEAFLPQPGQVSSSLPSTPAISQRNVVDPSTIIEWSAGLRCVMKTVAKHDHILHEVRHMIKTQHEHEEQWWKARNALMEKQKAREEGQKKLDDVLKAVGGTTSISNSNNGPEELARELTTFDMKVYKAQLQMVREMNAKLRGLGIPFFGTRSDLIRPAGKEVKKAPGARAMIDETELVQLQRRMVQMLEDLCND